MECVDISGKRIGDESLAYIIAEIGINHNGDVKLACETIDAALECGANAVKIQTYKTENFIHPDNPGFKTAKMCELSYEDYAFLFEYTRKRDGVIFSTPESLEDIQFLKNINSPAVKIASMDLNYKELIKSAARLGRPIILSTGMSYLNEVATAVRWIEEEGNKQIIILHCVSCYPTTIEECNLSAIPLLATTFNYPYGFSDHTVGIEIAFAAVCMGAKVIEKHFTLDKSLTGPDHACSASPDELKRLVSFVRNYEKAIGDGVKVPSTSEVSQRFRKRRGIYSRRALSKGDILTINDLQFLTPSTPESQLELINDFLGKKLKRDIPKYTLISSALLE